MGSITEAEVAWVLSTESSGPQTGQILGISWKAVKNADAWAPALEILTPRV